MLRVQWKQFCLVAVGCGCENTRYGVGGVMGAPCVEQGGVMGAPCVKREGLCEHHV